MSNAQELHKSLTSAGKTSEEAWEIVNNRFARKEDEPIDESVIKAAQDAVSDVFFKGDEKTPSGDPVNGSGPGEKIEKAEGDESAQSEVEYVYTNDSEQPSSDYDLVAIVSKGADQILESTEQQNVALAKGYMTLSNVTGDLAKAANAQNEKLRAINEKLDGLMKAMNTELPPRSVVSEAVESIDKPGESVSKGGGGVPLDSVVAKANTEIRATTDMNRRFNLVNAVAELDSGADPGDIAAKYHLEVQ